MTLYRDTGCKIQELLQPMSPIRISSQQSMAGFSGFYPCFQRKDLEPQMGQRDSLSPADSSFQRLTLEVSQLTRTSSLALRSTPGGMPQPCLFSVGEVPRKVI